MAAEGALSFSVASVVEDVLQQHGVRSRDLDLESRRAEEAASRRTEAAGWLRKMVGVVAARDLPAEPSEEEFRLGLRSGIILCNVLNKIQTGAVPKVVESPCDAALIPDGAPLTAFQYFENVRNFLVAVQEIGLPTFEASDLEQGGKSSRVVNCVLALKSYNDWKQTGGNGVWKFGGNIKSNNLGKNFVRKNSELFMNSLTRNSSMNEKSLGAPSADLTSYNLSNSGSFGMLVRALLSDKKPEEIPTLVESVLSKVVEEFETRMSSQHESIKTSQKAANGLHGNRYLNRQTLGEKKTGEKVFKAPRKEELDHKNGILDEEVSNRLHKQKTLFNQQQNDIEELRKTLHTTRAGMQYMQRKFHEEFSSLGMHIHGLAHAASGYHRVLEENRKLYNQVQDLKGSIRVYSRVRPFLPGQTNYLSTVESLDDDTITINTLSRHGKGQKSFTFNKVFGPSATQAEVFSDMQPLVRSVLDGYNVCIFAYGQTGSGKTYTMTGPRDLTEKSQGVNYRALGDLFLQAEQRKDTFRYDVAVQMIEIYNEQVRDLLVADGSNKRLEIRNSSQTGLSVPDASLVPVSSTYDVIDLMKLGQRNRAVGSTALNDRSSRSHSCLTVHVQGRDLTSGTILRGCMHLVDLAGSERVDRSEATGDRLKEAQHINKSLSALGDVIASLAQKNPHVPYRNSKLTQLLQDSLGGQAKTLMFVHISPETDALGETISTLKFAERVATVELGAAKVNKDGTDVKELKEQIATLKAALARKDAGTQQNKTPMTGSSKKHRNKSHDFIPYSPSHQVVGDMLTDHNTYRQPMGELGNIEICANSPSLSQKMQSCQVDEISATSPPWPPVASPGQKFRDDDRDLSSGEWVDKVMVNKHDPNRGCWHQDNGNLPDDLYQACLPDSSRIFSEQSYNMFMGNNRFNLASTDDIDDLDAGTTDSSEPDLLWQFNQTKLTTITNGIGSKSKKPVSKSMKSPQHSRSLHSATRLMPSEKPINGVGARGGRPVAPTEMKRKGGNRK